jgi:hypothetical protein
MAQTPTTTCHLLQNLRERLWCFGKERTPNMSGRFLQCFEVAQVETSGGGGSCGSTGEVESCHE